MAGGNYTRKYVRKAKELVNMTATSKPTEAITMYRKMFAIEA